ncbi:hypothetical protein Q3G72_000202 [Acer saccharum]|nr:hypothetical protein Q3G72_000202 [Acer saccharum]
MRSRVSFGKTRYPPSTSLTNQIFFPDHIELSNTSALYIWFQQKCDELKQKFDKLNEQAKLTDALIVLIFQRLMELKDCLDVFKARMQHLEEGFSAQRAEGQAYTQQIADISRHIAEQGWQIIDHSWQIREHSQQIADQTRQIADQGRHMSEEWDQRHLDDDQRSRAMREEWDRRRLDDEQRSRATMLQIDILREELERLRAQRSP